MICGLCKSGNTSIIGRTPDKVNIARNIYECNCCHSLTAEFKDTLSEHSVTSQVRFHEQLWRDSGDSDLNSDLSSLTGLVLSLKRHLGDPKPGNRILELGAGRGGLLKALRVAGYDAYGCEPATALVEKARMYYDLNDQILVKSDIATYLNEHTQNRIYNSVFLWHVFEHLDNPIDAIRKILDYVAEDGKIFMQVPLLKDAYVYPEHYFFMTHKSFHYLADVLELGLSELKYDEENMFATAVFDAGSDRFCHPFLNSFAIPDPLSQLILLTQKSRYAYKSILSSNFDAVKSADDSGSVKQSYNSDRVPHKYLACDNSCSEESGAITILASVNNDIGIRSEKFFGASHNRYWWYNLLDNQYIPPVFNALSEKEWAIMAAWFKDTEERFSGSGEISTPGISFLSGLIGGNGISRIVQCGHYAGYSSLMLGFLLRSMNKSNALFSVDISASMTEYAEEWIDIAGLAPVVKLQVADSADMDVPMQAYQWLCGDPQIVFIDSSHQYDHTLQELDRWYDCLAPGGFIVLNGVSVFSQQFDSTSRGGVLRAVREWADKKDVIPLLINSFVDGSKDPNSLTYKDGCGLGLIQKP